MIILCSKSPHCPIQYVFCNLSFWHYRHIRHPNCRILLVKVVFSNHHFQIWLFRADFQKECGFWVDLGLISSKTMFLLRILLMKVVSSNHFLKSPFSNLTFQSRFPKRMWFLNRFRLNLLKNHVPFENSAREGGFLKSLSQIAIFKSDFSEPISKKNVVFE